MRRDAPKGLLLWTAAFFVLLNLLLAQAVILAFYPNAGTRLGPAAFAVLAFAMLACGVVAARLWRSYLRRPPDR